MLAAIGFGLLSAASADSVGGDSGGSLRFGDRQLRSHDQIDPDYVGEFVGLDTGKVQIEILRRGQPEMAARFRAKNVRLVCDDGSVIYVTLGADGFRFRSARVFHGIKRGEDHVTGVTDRYEVRGRLPTTSTSRGNLDYEFHDPGVPSSIPERSCSTDGALRWEAERLSRNR